MGLSASKGKRREERAKGPQLRRPSGRTQRTPPSRSYSRQGPTPPLGPNNRSSRKKTKCSCCNQKFNIFDSLRRLYPPRRCSRCSREVCKKCFNNKCCHKCSTKEREDVKSLRRLEEMDRNQLVGILRELHYGTKETELISQTSNLIVAILKQCDMDEAFVQDFEDTVSKRNTPQITESVVHNQHQTLEKSFTESEVSKKADIIIGKNNKRMTGSQKDSPYDNGQPRFVDMFTHQQALNASADNSFDLPPPPPPPLFAPDDSLHSTLPTPIPSHAPTPNQSSHSLDAQVHVTITDMNKQKNESDVQKIKKTELEIGELTGEAKHKQESEQNESNNKSFSSEELKQKITEVLLVKPLVELVPVIEQKILTVNSKVQTMEPTVLSGEPLILAEESKIVLKGPKVALIPIVDTKILVAKSKIPVKESKIPVTEQKIPNNESKIPIKETKIPIKETKIPIKETKIPIKEPTIVLGEPNIPVLESTILGVEPKIEKVPVVIEQKQTTPREVAVAVEVNPMTTSSLRTSSIDVTPVIATLVPSKAQVVSTSPSPSKRLQVMSASEPLISRCQSLELDPSRPASIIEGSGRLTKQLSAVDKRRTYQEREVLEPLKTSTPRINRAQSLRSLPSVKAIEEFDLKRLKEIMERALENVSKEELATIVTNLWMIKRRMKPREQSVQVAMIGSLGDIADSDVISKLTVSQIKRILSQHKVSFQECQEKYEMVQKLTQLWNDINQRRGDGEELIPEGEQCVICLSQRANCVFMDCCHLVTCSDCSATVKECPVCRLFIVKALRVFKA